MLVDMSAWGDPERAAASPQLYPALALAGVLLGPALGSLLVVRQPVPGRSSW
jgi:hypothetical protein